MNTQANMQALMDGLSAQWQRERAASQMTLGAMIALLEGMAPDQEIEGIGEPHSYRGYYSDLAFERQQNPTTAGKLLAECKASMGQVFVGYKGGDFVMGALTPVWVALYGCTGDKLVSISPDGKLVTKPDEF